MSSVFPEINTQTYPSGDALYSPTQGLTKRELFAAVAMQGLFAADQADTLPITEAAKLAVRSADALIRELEKPDDD